MRLIQERCLIHSKNNKRSFWPNRSRSTRSIYIVISTASRSSINSPLGERIVEYRRKRTMRRSRDLSANSPDLKRRGNNVPRGRGGPCRNLFPSTADFRCCRLAGMKFQLRRPTAFNSTLEPFCLASRKIARLLSSRRLREREESGDEGRGEGGGGAGKKGNSWLVGEPRNKNGTRMFFKQFIARARAAKVPRGLRRQLYLQNNLTVP